jgi:hypothetical protein
MAPRRNSNLVAPTVYLCTLCALFPFISFSFLSVLKERKLAYVIVFVIICMSVFLLLNIDIQEFVGWKRLAPNYLEM